MSPLPLASSSPRIEHDAIPLDHGVSFERRAVCRCAHPRASPFAVTPAGQHLTPRMKCHATNRASMPLERAEKLPAAHLLRSDLLSSLPLANASPDGSNATLQTCPWCPLSLRNSLAARPGGSTVGFSPLSSACLLGFFFAQMLSQAPCPKTAAIHATNTANFVPENILTTERARRYNRQPRISNCLMCKCKVRSRAVPRSNKNSVLSSLFPGQLRFSCLFQLIERRGAAW